MKNLRPWAMRRDEHGPRRNWVPISVLRMRGTELKIITIAPCGLTEVEWEKIRERVSAGVIGTQCAVNVKKLRSSQ